MPPILINAATRLRASAEHLALLDPVADSLNHALTELNKAKTSIGSSKQLLALSQSIKNALTELQVLQEELED